MSDGARILVVDDSPATLEVVGRILSGKGHVVETAADVPNAVKRLTRMPVDLVITDFRMPGQDGLDLIRHVHENFPGTAVVMLTGFPSIEGAVEAVKGGAEAYLTKPFTQVELLAAVDEALVAVGRRSPASPAATHLPLVGRSDSARQLRATVDKLAASPDPVLIEAPPGRGGLAVARALHETSPRRHQPFELALCGLLGPSAADEIFGRKGGGRGLVEKADGGTLVLVEPGALDATAQVHLLRLLQERRCFATDGGRPRAVTTRVVAIARRDLARLAGTGRFRRDLLERLAAHRIHLPPLVERAEDIADIVLACATVEAQRCGGQKPVFSDRALTTLTESTWPGDLAEVISTVWSVIARVDGRMIEVSDLPPRFRFTAVIDEGDAVLTLADVERAHVQTVLDRVGGNKSEAARLLGIDRKTLRSKL